MIIWNLTYQATPTSAVVTKTLAAWGITNFKRKRVSQAPDEISFTTAEKSTTDPQFAYDGKVTVTAVKNGISTIWFVGWIGDPSQSLSGTQERRNYKAKNAWKWFDQIVFQKIWYRAVNPASADSSLIGGYRSKMILNMGFNGSHQTISQQMTEIVAFVNQMATAEGIGDLLQLGVCPVTTPPWSDVNDITVGEAVKHQMRWTPDAVTAFDYTTTPPTLNIKKVLVPLTINLADDVIGTVNLTPRNDRVVDRVRIKYAQQNNTNGRAWIYDVWDIYPVPPNGSGTFLAEAVGGGYYYISPAGTIVKSNTPPLNGVTGVIPAPPTAPENTFKELLLSVNMVGWVSSYVSATIETMPWGSANWLRRKLPFLRATGSSLTSYGLQQVLNQDGSQVGGYLLNDVLTGSVVDGLKFANGNPLIAQQYTAIYALDHQQTIAGTKNSKSETQTIKFTATNASSGTYSGLQSSSSGDPIPSGLAQSLYDGLKILQHDGSVTIKSQEIDPSKVWIGNKLSIAGGSSYWQNMMIQTVEESVDTASVTVSVGVPRYLSAGDLVELLRVTRFRQRFIAPDTVQTGQGAGGTANALPKNTNADNSVGGHSIHNVQTFISAAPVNNTLPTTHLKVVVNAEAGSFKMESVGGTSQNNSLGVTVASGSAISMLLSACNGKELSVREYTICVNNVTKKVLLLGSAPY